MAVPTSFHPPVCVQNLVTDPEWTDGWLASSRSFLHLFIIPGGIHFIFISFITASCIFEMKLSFHFSGPPSSAPSSSPSASLIPLRVLFHLFWQRLVIQFDATLIHYALLLLVSRIFAFSLPLIASLCDAPVYPRGQRGVCAI